MNKIAKDWWKENIKEYKMPLYTGTFSNPLHDDIDESLTFKTLDAFLKYFISFRTNVYEVEILKNIFYNNGCTTAFDYITHLKNESELDSPNTNNLNSYFNSFKNNFINKNFFIKDSQLWKLVNSNIEKGQDFCFGITDFYKLTFYSSTPARMNGYFYALSKKHQLNNIDAITNDAKETILKIPPLVNDVKDNIELLKDSIKENDIQTKNVIKNFNGDFSQIKEDLLKEKRKLMLSGPLEIWYDRLTEYTGYKYVKKEGNEFIYEKYKEIDKETGKPLPITKENMGKVAFYKAWSICWALFGFLMFAGAFAGIIATIKDWDNHTTKISVILSVSGSFFMFIYGYILKILVKNWNSARHIEEEISDRIALTQFYLALLQDEQIDKENASIPIQAIFKKYETGLLKEATGGINILEHISNIKNRS